MKKLTLLIFLALALWGCKSFTHSELTLLTDDPALFEAVLRFNAEDNGFSIAAEFIDPTTEDIAAFSKLRESQKYDIVAGSYYPLYSINFEKHSKLAYNNEDGRYYSFVDSFYNQSAETAIIYSYDFPLLVTAASNTVPTAITLADFRKQAAADSTPPQSEGDSYRFAFIPQLSTMPDFEYYCMGHDLFTADTNREKLNSEGFNTGLNFYHNFNHSLINSVDLKKLVNSYAKIDKPFYIRNNIQKYDFRYASEALNLPAAEYKLVFIKDNPTLSLKQKIITMRKNLFIKKEVDIFIEKLLSEEYQLAMQEFSERTVLTYGQRSLPILKHAIFKSTLPPAQKEQIDTYVSTLHYPYFGKGKRQKEFIQAYTVAIDMIAKERLKRDDLVDFIEKQLK